MSVVSYTTLADSATVVFAAEVGTAFLVVVVTAVTEEVALAVDNVCSSPVVADNTAEDMTAAELESEAFAVVKAVDWSERGLFDGRVLPQAVKEMQRSVTRSPAINVFIPYLLWLVLFLKMQSFNQILP